MDNHVHMVALYTTWYNFARINSAVRMSPAMACGLGTAPLGYWRYREADRGMGEWGRTLKLSRLFNLAMGIMAIIGAIGGVLRRKFVLLESKIDIAKPTRLRASRGPSCFRLVAATLTGFGGLFIWAASGLQP